MFRSKSHGESREIKSEKGSDNHYKVVGGEENGYPEREGRLKFERGRKGWEVKVRTEKMMMVKMMIGTRVS